MMIALLISVVMIVLVLILMYLLMKDKKIGSDKANISTFTSPPSRDLNFTDKEIKEIKAGKKYKFMSKKCDDDFAECFKRGGPFGECIPLSQECSKGVKAAYDLIKNSPGFSDKEKEENKRWKAAISKCFYTSLDCSRLPAKSFDVCEKEQSECSDEAARSSWNI